MFHPLKKITLLTAEEHSALFGCIDELLPLHKGILIDYYMSILPYCSSCFSKLILFETPSII